MLPPIRLNANNLTGPPHSHICMYRLDATFIDIVVLIVANQSEIYCNYD